MLGEYLTQRKKARLVECSNQFKTFRKCLKVKTHYFWQNQKLSLRCDAVIVTESETIKYGEILLAVFRSAHGRPEWGKSGAVTLLGFENDYVMCCFRAKYPKIFADAFGAHMKYFKSSLKAWTHLR